jgi:hypothetical protein
MRCVSVMFSDGMKRRTGEKSSMLAVKIDRYVRTGINLKDFSSTHRETEKKSESSDDNSSSAGGEMQTHWAARRTPTS